MLSELVKLNDVRTALVVALDELNSIYFMCGYNETYGSHCGCKVSPPVLGDSPHKVSWKHDLKNSHVARPAHTDFFSDMHIYRMAVFFIIFTECTVIASTPKT